MGRTLGVEAGCLLCAEEEASLPSKGPTNLQSVDADQELWAHGVRDPQARRGVAILAAVVDPDEQEEVGLLSYCGEGEEYACTLGHLLGFP